MRACRIYATAVVGLMAAGATLQGAEAESTRSLSFFKGFSFDKAPGALHTQMPEVTTNAVGLRLAAVSAEQRALGL